MFDTYFGLIVLIGIAVALGMGLVGVSRWLGPRRHEAATLDPYECGIVESQDPRRRTAVRYYLTAVLFILFDIEAAFLWAWAVVFHEAPVSHLLLMGVFLGVLTLGLWYVWAKGALEWE
jgi:NADH-quinone oxidoreductase subunit A